MCFHINVFVVFTIYFNFTLITKKYVPWAGRISHLGERLSSSKMSNWILLDITVDHVHPVKHKKIVDLKLRSNIFSVIACLVLTGNNYTETKYHMVVGAANENVFQRSSRIKMSDVYILTLKQKERLLFPVST